MSGGGNSKEKKLGSEVEKEEWAREKRRVIERSGGREREKERKSWV